MTVAFYTLGCKVNQYESEAMAEQLIKNGYTIVNHTDNHIDYNNVSKLLKSHQKKKTTPYAANNESKVSKIMVTPLCTNLCKRGMDG